MKLFMQMLSFFSGFVLCAAEPCFTNVTIRQSNPYPWGGSIVVGYEAKNDFAGWAYTNGCLLTTHLRSINPDAEAAQRVQLAKSVTGELSTAEGAHEVSWDVERDGVALASERVSMEVVTVKTPAQFCVIDVSAGADAARYPVEYLAGEPAGGFNQDVYKTTKIVLKRVNPGSYVAGSNQTASVSETHKVTLTKSYFLGLFELTQKQWTLVMGTEPTTGYGKGDRYAVYKVSYDAVVGQEDDGFNWPDTGNAVSPIQSDPVPVRDVPIVAEAAAPTLRECAATAAPATSRRRRASWASASACPCRNERAGEEPPIRPESLV